jgi:arsenate reductase
MPTNDAVNPVRKPTVLFLCTGNSARSQMAEALLRHYADDNFAVHSAGTMPTGLNPLTKQVMAEMGIGLEGHRSKHVREYLGRLPVRIVIIVCREAERACPCAWPGVFTRLFWDFQDPAACRGTEAERLALFRKVRDQIDQQIRTWLGDIGVELSPGLVTGGQTALTGLMYSRWR